MTLMERCRDGVRLKMNKLVKMFKAIDEVGILGDIEVMNMLSPNAFKLYISLINANANFRPSTKYVEYLLGVSKSTALRAMDELKENDLLTLNRVGYRKYVWHISIRPYNMNEIRQQKELAKRARAVYKTKEISEEVLSKIEDLEERLKVATGDDYIEVQKELIKIKSEKS